MPQEKYEFSYDVFDSIDELNKEDAWLLNEAKEVTQDAYAPYSRFHVGAVAKLSNGNIVVGTNQENASYPVGICAERVLLGSAATLYPGVSIDTIAVSYDGDDIKSDHPISPCGMCRQSLLEYEERTKQPIRLVLAGQKGRVFLLSSSRLLLPFAFTPDEFK
jgi:cytidine deaminase